MSNEDTTPVISKTAFSCPHCGAYTTQTWYSIFVKPYGQDHRTPSIPNEESLEFFKTKPDMEKDLRDNLVQWCEKMMLGKPFFENSDKTPYTAPILQNCNLARCYNCKEISIWVYDRIVYPTSKIDIKPNGDLPEHIQQLFDEAREIVESSPKGAAALLRLSIQYLCKELGESGKNIDKDIASLVSKGLNPLVQKSLDIVRVIGNESVHPGEIDLNDNKEIALKLFGLVNLIAEQMISHPKQVESLYGTLPQNKLDGIEKRNTKASQNKNT